MSFKMIAACKCLMGKEKQGTQIETIVAVFLKDKRLLMERRSKDRGVYAGFLMCPSGHLEQGESLEQAMKREMKEELGIEIKGQRFLFAIDDLDSFSKKLFKHNFMLIKDFEGKIDESSEAKSLCWKSYKELEGQKLALIARKLVEKLREQGLF